MYLRFSCNYPFPGKILLLFGERIINIKHAKLSDVYFNCIIDNFGLSKKMNDA